MGSRRRTRMWDLAGLAMKRECPACGAPPETRCWSLQDPEWREERREVSMPHPERYPGGNRLIGDPVNAAALTEARTT